MGPRAQSVADQLAGTSKGVVRGMGRGMMGPSLDRPGGVSGRVWEVVWELECGQERIVDGDTDAGRFEMGI